MSVLILSRPQMVVPVSGEQLPKALTGLRQWVDWHYAMRDGKWNKVPLQTNGKLAKVNQPGTWSTFDEALEAAKRHSDRGLGFVFQEGGGLTGIDVDHCIENGNLKAWARPIMEMFGDTYAEISPSATGVKIFCRGDLNGLLAKNDATGTRKTYKDGAVEVYHHGRFFTATARVFNGAALELCAHRPDLEHLLNLLGVPKPGGTSADAASRQQATHEQASPTQPLRVLSDDDIVALRTQTERARKVNRKFAELWEGGACG